MLSCMVGSKATHSAHLAEWFTNHLHEVPIGIWLQQAPELYEDLAEIILKVFMESSINLIWGSSLDELHIE